MNASKNCVDKLIKPFEGFSAKPYKCPADVWTIGYGSTRYPNGRAVKESDSPITEEVATMMVLQNLREYENAVNRYVSVPLSQNQFDALVDFAYNAGAQNLRNSTLLKKLNAKDYFGASKEFSKWVYGGGKILPGLVKRREAERLLFLS